MATKTKMGLVLSMPDDSQELVDYYDETGNIIGVTTHRKADEQNLIYPNAIVFIFTPDGKAWIQKRSRNKRFFPGLWDVSACGAIAHGEDPKTAAERELFEEMGLMSDLQFVEKFLNTFPSVEGSAPHARISHLFIGSSPDTPSGNDEVETVEAMDADDLLKRAQKHPEQFVPSFHLELKKALTAFRSQA